MNPLTLLGLVPSWAWAGLLAASVVHSCNLSRELDGQKVETANARTEVATTRAQLTMRIAAEATAVAAGVKDALDKERAAQATQKEKVNALEQATAAGRADLAAARDGMRVLIAAAADATARAGCPDLPAIPGQLASGALEAEADRLRAAGERLAADVLGIAEDANAVTRERNLLSEELLACRRMTGG